MNIKKIKVGSLKTNCYLLISKGEILIIDPGGEAEKIIKELDKEDGKPIGIINTHSHYDHVGANKALEEHFNTRVLNPESKLKVGNLKMQIIKTPGHKNDSICIIGETFAFTGDTIFENVHGRVDLEEGSIQKMEESLEKLSKNLKIGMMIYPGHGKSFNLQTKNLKDKYLKND